jgi:hypothetical protein
MNDFCSALAELVVERIKADGYDPNMVIIPPGKFGVYIDITFYIGPGHMLEVDIFEDGAYCEEEYDSPNPNKVGRGLGRAGFEDLIDPDTDPQDVVNEIIAIFKRDTSYGK